MSAEGKEARYREARERRRAEDAQEEAIVASARAEWEARIAAIPPRTRTPFPSHSPTAIHPQPLTPHSPTHPFALAGLLGPQKKAT